jgi:nucleoside-diphosphate-sugar epimerase
MLTHEYYKNKPVLITGGCGFIGSHIAQKLVEYGAHVTIIDDLSTGSLANIENIKHNITFIEDNIVNFDACMRACKGQAFVFHQAAYISVPGSLENPAICNSTNVTGTFNLLEAARQNHVERFIFASSAAIYGQREGLCREDMQPNPNSPYGFSKFINEIHAQQYTNTYKLNTIGLRYFNVYGPRQNPHGTYAAVVTKLQYQMAHNLPITIFGDGTQTRDFIHVSRVVQANLNLALLDPKITQGQIYNIATGMSISLLTLIQQLKKYYPNYSGDIVLQPKRSGDVTDSRADCSKYRNTCIQQSIDAWWQTPAPTPTTIQVE